MNSLPAAVGAVPYIAAHSLLSVPDLRVARRQ